MAQVALVLAVRLFIPNGEDLDNCSVFYDELISKKIQVRLLFLYRLTLSFLFNVQVDASFQIRFKILNVVEFVQVFDSHTISIISYGPDIGCVSVTVPLFNANEELSRS